MTRRKQNCPKRMKWEGGEGEEPPEEIQEDEDGDEEDEDGSRNSTGTPDMIPDSRIASPITVLQEENTQPIDLANSELLAINSGQSPLHSAKDTLLATQRSSATPPPPILERCSSGESLDSAAEDEGPASVFQPVPPRLATMVSASSPLISSSSSPPLLLPVNATTPPLKSPIVAAAAAAAATVNEAVLDFSTKRRPDDNLSPVLNLSKSGNSSSASESSFVANGPLDLSLGSNKKRELEDPQIGGSVHKKPARMPATPISPWSSPLLTYQLPYFAPGGVPLMQKNNNAAGSGGSAGVPSGSPLHSMDAAAAAAAAVWNGKAKISEKNHFGGMSLAPSDATKALEKMSELSKLGVVDEFRPVIPLSPNVSGSGGGRHSAWQSHWLNKGADQAKDVLKCVWCKQSFPSLAAMTAHMQEAKHCGVNVPGVSPLQQSITSISTPSQTSTTTSSVSSSSVSSNKSSSDLNLLIKETMPLPRKLVRGQDVWLGKGAEQTRQILKCMWCGQSFRSLAEMTSHMQQTQHYTNIISQEQIISWKSSDEGKSGGGNSGHSASGGGSGTGGGNANSNSTNSHVSAVLTCKVCDQAFSSLKELSNHMVKNSHYKEHIMRSITESGGRRRQTREKRKKSLPVRKLLELERAQNELKNGGDNMMMTMMMMGGKPGSLHGSSSNRITCEKCGDKIDMAVFVDHIRICVGANATLTDEKKNLLKNALMSSYNNASESLTESAAATKGGKDPPYQRLSPKASDLSVSGKEAGGGKSDKSSSPSVLNAIEKLIEKSFDPRSRHAVAGYPGCQPSSTSPIGSSILKRLGIDESVDYTKPLMDVNLQAAKAYMLGSHQFHNSHYDQNYFSGGRRERSGSESSSVSERGSSRHESSTPDRKFDDRTPQTTPEKRPSSSPQPPKSNESATKEHLAAEIKEEPAVDEDVKPDIKLEPDTDKEDDDGKRSEKDAGTPRRSSSDSSTTSKSIPAGGDDLGEDLSTSGKRKKPTGDSSPATVASPSRPERASVSPSTAMTGSPTNSERSITPRSTSDKKSAGSLGALSSMFDSLSGTNTSSASSEAPAQSNKASNHPLAALQKLCDKTETHHHPASGGGSSRANSSAASANHSGSTTPQSNTPGAILAFSWACNDAVVTDSIMKCAFCDTPFISKGAYRHHLSKMHFVKDGVIPDPVPLKSPGSNSASSIQNTSLPTSLSTKNSQPENCKAGSAPVSTSSSTSSIKSPQPQTFDESPHSKFLKYTELAKQLSSKYV